MASIWIQTAGSKRPAKLAAGLAPATAQAQLAAMLLRYVQEKPGRKVTRVSGLDAILLDSKGRVYANLYVEPLSPPSAPEPGDFRRVTPQGGA